MQAQKKPLKLSVIIPAFNEGKTLPHILPKVLAVPLPKEVIIIDDGSTDLTPQVLAPYRGRDDVKILCNPVNIGKGAAIRQALLEVRGDLVIIQDADLELDPQDYLKLIDRHEATGCPVIYGVRRICRDTGLRGNPAHLFFEDRERLSRPDSRRFLRRRRKVRTDGGYPGPPEEDR